MLISNIILRHIQMCTAIVQSSCEEVSEIFPAVFPILISPFPTIGTFIEIHGAFDNFPRVVVNY